MHQPIEVKKDLEIRFLRLGTGEDIITWCLRLHQEEDGVDGWFLRDSVVVIVEVDPELQKQTCIMMPWLPRGIVDNTDAIITNDEVVVVKKIEKDVEEYYKQLCREVFPHKPKILSAKKAIDDQGKNVFGFDMNKVRPVKGIKNEEKQKETQESPKANT